MKKKILLMLVLLIGAVTGAMAEKTPQVIWCEGNATMYFTNSDTLYAAGDTLATLTTARPLPACGAVFLSLMPFPTVMGCRSGMIFETMS